MLLLAFLANSTVISYAQYSGTELNSQTPIYVVDNLLEQRYSNFISNTDLSPYKGQVVKYRASSVILRDGRIVNDSEKGQVVKVAMGEEVEFTIEAPEDALYYINFTYMSNDDSILPIEASIMVNGEYPFREAKRVLFESRWTQAANIPVDRYGNEVVPMPKKLKAWESKYIMDSSYRHDGPLFIPLLKGTNIITFRVEEGNILVSDILLHPQEDVVDYTPKAVEGNNIIIIEAENITYRNDPSIRPGSEFDVDVTPYKADRRVLNILDPWSFKNSGQKVEYEFHVEQSGYYYIAFNYRQDSKLDFPVFVNILIDGKVPYQQLKAYPFDYSRNFVNVLLQDKTTGEKIAVYLDEGVHTISLVLTLQPLIYVIEAIEDILMEINKFSLEIMKLTGSKKDRYRDYELEKHIPDVKGKLLGWADNLEALYENIAVYNPKVRNIGAFSSLLIASNQLKSLAKKPNDLPRRMSELSEGPSSVSQYLANLLQSINNNGIAIDKIYILQDEKSLPQKANIFVKTYESIKRFVLSFTEQDYSIYNTNPEHLQVWVNRPRQYVEILQKMVDEDFTPRTGIKVDLSLMPDQNKLILANAAGKAPDVATAVHFALPFELAIRGALQDLSEFEDFKEVAQRFPQGLLIPSMIGSSVYSVPETFYFWVLFYRTDILQAINIPVPQTLEDVKSILPELQRRGMNFYYPAAGMSSFKTFAATMPLIYQSRGKFYGDQVDKTLLNDEKTLNGIRELTELFTIYNIPYEVPSFYQHFRNGILPIGIADYFMYNLLINAAPEIANLWDIALFPGIMDEDGSIQRWSAGGAENCIIFKNTDKKEAAWEYLKWWTDRKTQVEFGYRLQTSYGREYIWNSANIEAFKELPWNSRHKEIILQQTQWLIEVPRVPGTYMLERELSNAFNAIVLDGQNLRKAVDLAVKRINRETYRKLEEFGYMRNGVMVKPYYLPQADFIK
jgi:ABC-type glycerol-3-phosphate transport system substrate-binding protein